MRRTWKYLVALLGRRLEDAADPEIQIEQAIEESKQQHARLVQQAAAVIGNERQLALRLSRMIDQVAGLRSSAREALVLADQARASDDAGGAVKYEQTAQSFAVALVSTESEMRDLKQLHDRAIEGAAGAREAVETNALELRRQLTERTRLLSQLEQTKLQERMNAALMTMNSLAPTSDQPTMEHVRDKIEQRYSNALGMAEMSSTAIEVQRLTMHKASLDAEAERQLASLRLSLAAGQRDRGEGDGQGPGSADVD